MFEKPLLEERAKVIRIDDHYLWLESIRQSACQACQSKSDCGHHKLTEWQQSFSVKINDRASTNAVEVAVEGKVDRSDQSKDGSFLDTDTTKNSKSSQDVSASGKSNYFRVVRPLSQTSGKIEFKIGDEVVIGVEQGAVIKSSLWVYGMPLVAMMIAAMATSLIGLSEPLVILLSFAGLAMGFGFLKRFEYRLSHHDQDLDHNSSQLSVFTPTFVRKIRNQ